MKIKRQTPTKKCVKYIKKMINQNTWINDERIPTLSKISKTLSISIGTVRKSLRYFEKIGIIRNYGYLGFFVKSNTNSLIKHKNPNIAEEFKIKVEAAKLLRLGGIELKEWIIKYYNQSNKIVALNIISGLKIECIIDIINKIIRNPITLDLILSKKDNIEFKNTMELYNTQQKLLPLAKLILSHKKEIFK